MTLPLPRTLHLLFRSLTGLALVALPASQAMAGDFPNATSTTPFTIAVIPDSQIMVQNSPSLFTNQVKWIKDNRTALNIKFVSHVGDLVNNSGSSTQWTNGAAAMYQLDGVLPYAIAPGNHDSSSGDYSTFNAKFPFSKFSGQAWFGGAFNNRTHNSYQLFSANGMDFIILHLAYAPDAAERAWASEVLAQHANRRAIISTHSFLTDSGRTAEGNAIWSDVVTKNKNVFMVICGHMHYERRFTYTNTFGNPVQCLLSDYQEESPQIGKLRYYTFKPGENKVEAYTYSTVRNAYTTGSASQFSFSYTMTGDSGTTLPSAHGKAVMAVNTQLNLNEYLVADSYRMHLQGDGNVVLRNAAGTALWSSGTAGKGGTRLVMGGDGNLVLYTASNSSVWASGTNGTGATKLVLGTNGALALYKDSTVVKTLYGGSTLAYALAVINGTGTGSTYAPGQAVPITANPAPAGQVFNTWVVNAGNPVIANAAAASTTLTMPAGNVTVTATYRQSPSGSNSLSPYGTLTTDQQLTSTNGQYRLILQGDGNLVLRNGAGSSLWATGTNGKGGNKLILQGDGNLVLFSPTTTVWSSGTVNSGANLLRLNDDGSLVLYRGTTVVKTLYGTQPPPSGTTFPWGSAQVHYTVSSGVNESGGGTKASPARSGDYELVFFGASHGGATTNDGTYFDKALMQNQGFQPVLVRGCDDRKAELWVRKNSGQTAFTMPGKAVAHILVVIDGSDVQLNLGGITSASTFSGGTSYTVPNPSGSGLKLLCYFSDDSVELTNVGNGKLLWQKWGFGDGDGFAVVLYAPGVALPSSVSINNQAPGGRQYVGIAANFPK